MSGGSADRRLDEVRAFYARQMAAASRSTDPRIERAFELVPREAFLPPGPWHILSAGNSLRTPSADPIHLYQNVLVALDRAKGINNGEPFLHAAWIGAVAPRPGETVVQVGAGAGYYTAILSMLVGERGRVVGYEIEPALAAHAARNCAPFDNVEIRAQDAVLAPLPPADVIYVNAGVTAPPLAWLEALKLGGRLVFPWRPTPDIGLSVLVERLAAGFSARVLGGAWFIACVGASDPDAAVKAPERAGASKVRSIVPTAGRPPDKSAVAVYRDLWFSSAEPHGLRPAKTG